MTSLNSIIARDLDAGAVTGVVNNIQHYCTEDGPGIRTTVFLKGCSLACKWCSNPESLHAKPELAYNPNNCLGCDACTLCLEACPESAIRLLPDEDKVSVDFSRCTNCGLCVDACPSKAMTLFGKSMTVEEVMREVEKDGNFFLESGGGLTLSGGECMAQPEFSAALLKAAHQRGYNTVVETAGNVPYANFQKVLPHVDLVLHDIKLVDKERHQHWTGVGNQRILQGLRRAYTEFPDKYFVARTPIIPGINDTEADVQAVLDFIRPYKNVVAYQLLAYHRFGESRYGYLGRDYELENFRSPEDDDMNRLRTLVDKAFGREGSSLATSYPLGMDI